MIPETMLPAGRAPRRGLVLHASYFLSSRKAHRAYPGPSPLTCFDFAQHERSFFAPHAALILSEVEG